MHGAHSKASARAQSPLLKASIIIPTNRLSIIAEFLDRLTYCHILYFIVDVEWTGLHNVAQDSIRFGMLCPNYVVIIEYVCKHSRNARYTHSNAFRPIFSISMVLVRSYKCSISKTK